MDTNTDANHMIAQWSRTYHYGHIILPGICIGTCGLYAFSALRSNKNWRRYAVAGIMTLTLVPFTWIIMTPTNNTLFALEAAGNVSDLGYVHRLVVKWTWMHAARSVFPLIGAILGFTGIMTDLGL
jgi:ABC-type iron transport system FetAB permease component